MIADRASGFITPCLPTAAERPPAEPGWIHEIKHEGERLMARRDRRGVRLLTRSGRDRSARYPAIAAAVGALHCRSCLIDGVAGEGFRAPRRRRHRLFAFDLLELDGRDLRREPIETRKQLLAKLLGDAERALQLSEDMAAAGDVVFRYACELGFAGIVSKRRGSRYRSGRSRDWTATEKSGRR